MSLRIENHTARAYDLMRLQRYDLALDEVQAALEQDPHSAEAHVCGAWVLRGMGRLEEAEDAARAALSSNPHLADGHNALACVLWSQGRLLEAETSFEEMLSYPNPSRTFHLTNYIRFLLANNRPKEALGRADEAVSLSPNLSVAYELRGTALYALRRYDEAATIFHEALRLNPLNAEAHHRLGQIELVSGNAQEAIPSLLESLRLKPNSREARAGLALALRARHPIYGRLLAITLWSKSPRSMVYFYWVSGAAMALLFLFQIMDTLLYGSSGPMSEDAKNLFNLQLLAIFTLYLACIAWWRLVDPLFNTLLMFDPMGRRVLEYDLTDAVGVGLMALSALCLLGFFGALLVSGPFSTATLFALCLCLAGVLSVIFSGVTRHVRGARKWVAWVSYVLLVASLYAMAVAIALRQNSLGSVAYFTFLAALAIYMVVWILAVMEARKVTASTKRSILRGLAVRLAFMIVGAIAGIILNLNIMGIVSLACAGFYGSWFFLALKEPFGDSSAPLYRRWTVRYGETSARWWVPIVFAAATLFLVGMAFLFPNPK